MIKSISIENYKSIDKLTLGLGRVTVLIGENGCGKSNILEAIALASASAAKKLDNEFLSSRGVRVTEAAYMRSAFIKDNLVNPINVGITGINGESYQCALRNDNSPYSKWTVESHISSSTKPDLPSSKEILADLKEANQFAEKVKQLSVQAQTDLFAKFPSVKDSIDKIDNLYDRWETIVSKFITNLSIDEYLIYSPENSALRSFGMDSSIQPLGSKGEGLYKLLKFMQASEPTSFNELKEHLRLMGWFKDISIPTDLGFSENKLEIQDRFIDESLSNFDQNSANEGFLLLLFYLAVFLSDKAPKFFAIDNIDTSLNPKLCQRLIIDLASLAKKYGKQVIFSTHNPAVLDGLNLNDEDQQLWVVSRDRSGKTKVNRVSKPIIQEGQPPVKLSEAFLRGAIGGLPKRF